MQKLLPQHVIPTATTRGFFALGLYRPKTPVNVGAALRNASAFGAAFVASCPKRPRYHGAPTDTTKAARHLPLLHVEDLHEVIPHDCVPVVIEVTERATSLVQYKHPARAFYIFGPEDGAAPLSFANDVLVIPSRFCLNLAAAVAVVLYDRLMKGWH